MLQEVASIHGTLRVGRWCPGVRGRVRADCTRAGRGRGGHVLRTHAILAAVAEPFRRTARRGWHAGRRGTFLIGLMMAAAGGYLLLQPGAGDDFVLALRRVRRLRPDAGAAAGRRRVPLLQRPIDRRLAAHRGRRHDHPGRRADEHGHLLPPDQPVQHADDARAAVRRPRAWSRAPCAGLERRSRIVSAPSPMPVRWLLASWSPSSTRCTRTSGSGGGRGHGLRGAPGRPLLPRLLHARGVRPWCGC